MKLLERPEVRKLPAEPMLRAAFSIHTPAAFSSHSNSFICQITIVCVSECFSGKTDSDFQNKSFVSALKHVKSFLRVCKVQTVLLQNFR